MFEEMDVKLKIIIVLIITNLLSMGYTVYHYIQKPAEVETELSDDKPSFIYVHIRGEVNLPGYYEIKSGTHLNDLIKLAGGATSDADIHAINLSLEVKDQQQITIPKINTSVNENGEIVVEEPDYDDHLININTASLSDLKTLTGIGDVKAKAIIDYRNTHGAFLSIEEIMNVKGIGEATFNGIKDFIRV
jgi:competence protein ComEA